ncbi:hypothetical protein M011DRAFT_410397 [Sporormia fimetaria CBS 119925]|uniref:Uncharacterized protein n=1 Tax=Sporormia fimetaria CBS 119925 TaxID=1340428 RepID=A0A6A6V1I2_9PLEO|nr:hypothetical protein M011DRAFT_410397 [Sporormia fimetaria CBS 119925]
MANSNSNPISVPSSQTQRISDETRNAIYSALLSDGGIVNIESTLTDQLERTGWLANLRQYVTYLLRTGEATTVDEIMAKVKEKMKAPASAQNTNGAWASTNGVNGVNGHSSLASDEPDLKVPKEAITQGTLAIREELEKVCEVVDDEN